MKPHLSQRRNAAMTLFEVGIVIAVILVLAVLFLSRTAKSYSPETTCVNNLKQVGLSFKMWAGDNDDLMPMGVVVTNGGAMELVRTGNVLSAFLVMSNELGTPRVLLCPADTAHLTANDFDGLTSSNLSYFVSVDMTNDMNPQMILTGDSDLLLGGKKLPPGLAQLRSSDPVNWDIRHPKSEQIGLADGSVQTVTSGGFRSQLMLTGFATNRFAIP